MTAPSRNPTTNHRLQGSATTSRPPKPGPTPAALTGAHPITALDHPNPNPITASSSNSPFAPSPEDEFLSRASHLTRPELLRRRAHNLRQLSRCYRDYYWALMEELKAQHRDYYWTYGASPFKEDQAQREDAAAAGEGGGAQVEEGVGENLNNGNISSGGGGGGGSVKCLASGCKSKAMALTSFCLLHILQDKKQKLYRPCGYVIKRDILCGKAILRSTSPPLCSSHFQRAQKHVLKALKKAGLNVSLSNKLAPKLHIVVAEYVRQIQSKRRAAKRANPGTTAQKESGGR